MTSVMSVETPISHLDPYSDRALIDPWPTYGELQDAGPAVWLSKYDMFALTRYDSVSNHLAFGAGPHVCAGINLARLVMNAIFSSLAKMVRRFHIEHQERIVNNVLRGFARLNVSIERL